MALSVKQKAEIKALVELTIKNKLSRYTRESKSMPFLSALMQDDEKVASYSFIQSMATTLGMSLYEQFSVIIATPNSEACARNVKVGGTLSSKQKGMIGDIVNALREGRRSPSISNEIKEVLKISGSGGIAQKGGNVADFYMKKGGVEHFFEIKTVKPNIDVFEKSKTKLLEWAARKGKGVKPFLAFPYNPYAPDPYSRFTMVNMMDIGKDFLVGEEYWDLIGGKGTYIDLIDSIEEAGKGCREAIQKKIKEVAKKKIAKV